MKRGVIAVLVFVSLLLPVLAGAAKNPWEFKMPFKSATIYYELSGMETGEEIIYIRKNGEETAEHHTSTTSMLGMTMKNRTVVITTPDWVYSFDLEERTGSKSINPQKLMIEEYNKLTKAEKKEVDKNAKEMGTSMMNGMQGSLEKNAKEILGYSCDKATIMGSTVYSIHETPIALYSDSNIMGIKVKSVATKIDTGAVSDAAFQFPEGIEPLSDPQADQMARSIARQTIAALKDPESVQQGDSTIEQQRADAIRQDSQEGEEQPADSSEAEEAVEQTMKVLKGLFGN